MSLVTLERAKAHLLIIGAADDAEVLSKIAEAEAIVLDYIGDRTNANGWNKLTAPGVITSAVLIVLGALWEGREAAAESPEPISDAVRRLLRRYRKPPLA